MANTVPRKGLKVVRERATIRDVAARADVSVATVSRALNGKGPIRSETVERVMTAVHALKYVPDAAARILSVRRSHTIGVVLPEVHGEFFSEVIRGIDLAARRSGYHLLVSGSHSEMNEMVAMVRAMRGRVDGLIVMSPDTDARPLSHDLPASMPAVFLNSPMAGRSSITIDNFAGAAAMTAHLLSCGHDRIAFITGPERNIDAAERLRGFREACGDRGPGLLQCMEFAGNFTEESGYSATREILQRVPRPTAIFAANDAMALGALRLLRELSIAVPDQMALAGFDDIPLARYLVPALTTVHVDIAELGRQAFDLLIQSLEESTVKRRRRSVVPATIIVRESCGARLEGPKRLHKQ